jgi:small subunit ribosomal protein S7
MTIIDREKSINYRNFTEKFINLLMVDGKKLKAYNIFFSMLQVLRDKSNLLSEKKSSNSLQQIKNSSMLYVVSKSIENCLPALEVRKVRVAGNTYLVPATISKKKQESLAIRWILEAARHRKKTTKFNFAQCLADEIFDCYFKQGYARQKRDELHRVAESNRAYIRYRWW